MIVCVDRVPLIDDWQTLESSSKTIAAAWTSVSLLLVGENDLTSDLLRDSTLELNREVELGTWLDLHRISINGQPQSRSQSKSGHPSNLTW